MKYWLQSLALIVGLSTAPIGLAAAKDVPPGVKGFSTKVKPFFQAYCIQCHGPEQSKGELGLHTLHGDLAKGEELERWETILEMLSSGSMPPAEEPQPADAARQEIVKWIESELRGSIRENQDVAGVAQIRRLTNFEYQNTIRDLLGFELKLIDNLPEDPLKPYHFNNAAEYLLIGPEQMDRYQENARRAMSAAIVDPEDPKIHRMQRTWKPEKFEEIGVYKGPGVHEPNIALRSWPQHGEFRIRIEAAAILPPGFDQVPLRLVMGTQLRHDSGTGDYEPVGTLILRNQVDSFQTFEFRGRIENHPVQVGEVTAKGQQPPKLFLYAQNLFDNGELNDHRKSAFDWSWSQEAPRVVLRSIEFESPIADPWPPEHHTRILFDSPLRNSDPDAYVGKVLQQFLSRAFRRPATEAEIARFAKIYQIFDSELETMEAAMRETLAMVLVSPNFLYHTVAQEGVVSRHYELASRLSYFLWGSMPDAELLQLAKQEQLDDPEVIEKQVLRMLADERSMDFIRNFATQWLSIDKMHSVVINQERFPRFLYYVHVGERRGQEVLFRPTIRDYMFQETTGFIGELIKRNSSVRALIDSDFAYLNEPLAVHYGVEGVKGIGLRPVKLKADNRLGGLLTQGSVLLSNSTGSAPHPIYRAVWLREAILGEKVKPPPAEVPALSDTAGESAEKAGTIKELLAMHRQKESCNDCHARLDPWGIPFERYNAIGQYQPKIPKENVRVRGFNQKLDQDLAAYQDYLASINRLAVQADTQLPNGPEVDGMRDLKDYLLRYREADIAENAIRRLLTYAIGRELTFRDRFAVKSLLDQAEETDYPLRDMIVAICQSRIFRNLPPQETN